MKERLKLILDYYNLSNVAFAESVELQESTVRAILTGKTQKISGPVLLALMEKYNINPVWFIRGEGKMLLPGDSAKVMQSDAPVLVENDMSKSTNQKKQNGHLTGIEGNVETYPDILSIEQIARTGWWANLTEEDRELYAINEELPHDATMRLRDAAEYEYRVNEKRIEEKKSQAKTLRQKGEAG